MESLFALSERSREGSFVQPLRGKPTRRTALRLPVSADALCPFGQRACEAGPLGPAGWSGEKRDLVGPASRSGVFVLAGRQAMLCRRRHGTGRAPLPGPRSASGEGEALTRHDLPRSWRQFSNRPVASGHDPIPRPPPRAITVMTELSCERDGGRINPVVGDGDIFGQFRLWGSAERAGDAGVSGCAGGARLG